MCPERATVAIIEDDQSNIDLMRRNLTKGGHTIAHVVESMEEAKQLITDLPDTIDALIIDANISPWIKDGSDGIELAKLAQKNHPDVPVVGFSINTFPKEATIYIDASPTGFAGLSHIIDTLPKRGVTPLTSVPVK